MSIQTQFAETVARCRRAKNLTQEELASRLGVSAQAVSNWEHGGYPDITLLPTLANHLGLTVDELLCNDELHRKSELAEIEKKCGELYNDPGTLLEYIKPLYYKYPQEYWIADSLGSVIVREKTHLEENMPLLREACERMYTEAIAPWTRENAVSYMCSACPDDELSKWLDRCAMYLGSNVDEVLEEREWYQGHKKEFYSRFDVNNFRILCHFLTRQNFDTDKRLLENAAKYAAWGKYRLRVMEHLCSTDGSVAPAWFGAMGQFCVQTSWSLFAIGEKEDGYNYLERAFDWYEKWCSIPDGMLLEVGDSAAFGGVKIKKGDFWNIVLPDGKKEWTPYGLLFMQNKGDLYNAMTQTHGGGWLTGCERFNAVCGEERFKELLKRAERMKDK